MNAKATKNISKAAHKPLWKFCLYVADRTPRSILAMENLTGFCEEQLPGQYKIKVVDVTSNPKFARLENIVALPMLARTAPEPIRKAIGDLTNTPRLPARMDLRLTA
jgi:circadian clock protein KaiB